MCLKYNKSFKHVVTASENSVSWNELTSLTLILFSKNDATVHDYTKEWQKKIGNPSAVFHFSLFPIFKFVWFFIILKTWFFMPAAVKAA